MSKYKVLNTRKSAKVLQMLSAFILGILISQLINPSFFNFEKTEIVDEKNYFLVILVLTAPKNVDQRNAIRETWLNLRPKDFNNSLYKIEIPKLDEFESIEMQRRNLENFQHWMPSSEKLKEKLLNFKLKTLFAVGRSGLEASQRRELDDEQQVYNDLLFLDDLKDSYANLTLKLVKSMRKITEILPHFEYLLKCDDDTYVKLDYLTMDLIQWNKRSSVSHLRVKKSVENYLMFNKDVEEHQKLTEGLNLTESEEDPQNYNKNHLRVKKSVNVLQSDINKPLETSLTPLELYWGFFNGRARIKTSGPWRESNFNLCDHYLPYALGGGYVISSNLVKFIAQYQNFLTLYKSEDVSMGAWLSPFKNIHRRHDTRFDTAYMPRKCRDYHIVMHKKTAMEMREISSGNYRCEDGNVKRPLEYFYDWTQPPSKCCDTRVY